MSLARAAGVDEDDVALLPVRRLQEVLGEFSVRRARAASEKEDRRFLRMRAARGNEDDLERQLASAARLPVLVDLIGSAAQFLPDVSHATGRQCQLRMPRLRPYGRSAKADDAACQGHGRWPEPTRSR